MKIGIEKEYNFTPTMANGHGYSELIALANGNAVGISFRARDRLYKLQIFENEGIRYLDLPENLFDSSFAPNVIFALGNRPVIITNKLFVLYFSENLRDFLISEISDSTKVFRNDELSGRLPRFGLHSGNTVNNEVLLSMSYSSLSNQNELVKISIDVRKATAKWIPLYSQKDSWFKRSYRYRGSLNLEQFPRNFGYPTWSSSPVVYSLLNIDDGFLIFSCGDWLVKGSGHSYNSISRITDDLNLLEHLYMENYHAKKDGKNWGKFGIFSSDRKYCIVTPKYKKKVEENWFGKQRLYLLKDNRFDIVDLPRGFSKYEMKDINDVFFWLEYWDRKTNTRHIVKGKKK